MILDLSAEAVRQPRVAAHARAYGPVLTVFCTRLTERSPHWHLPECVERDGTIHAMPCEHLTVPTTTCYVTFGGDRRDVTSKEIGVTTRAETVIVDYDTSGRIVGFELVEPSLKPCQGETARHLPG